MRNDSPLAVRTRSCEIRDVCLWRGEAWLLSPDESKFRKPFQEEVDFSSRRRGEGSLASLRVSSSSYGAPAFELSLQGVFWRAQQAETSNITVRRSQASSGLDAAADLEDELAGSTGAGDAVQEQGVGRLCRRLLSLHREAGTASFAPVAALERVRACEEHSIVLVGGVHSHMYFHQLLDDIFSFFRVLEDFGVLPRGDEKKHSEDGDFAAALERSPFADLTLLDDSGPHARRSGRAHFSTAFAPTSASLSSLSSPPRRTFRDVLFDSHLYPLCARRLLLGSGGRQAGGFGTLLVDRNADIPRFRRFLRARLCHFFSPKDLVVVIQRETVRRIANLPEVVRVLRTLPGHPEVRVRSLDHGWDLHAQAELFCRASLIVAVHGSSLSNMVFLPPGGGSVLEIFPFGVARGSYRKLAGALGLRYVSWTNPHRNATSFHTRFLARAPPGERERALHVSRLGGKYEPGMGWFAERYFLNQDTVVDSDAVFSLARTLIHANDVEIT